MSNVNALARTLRASGYASIARNLGRRLADGLTSGEWRGRRFRFRLVSDDSDGAQWALEVRHAKRNQWYRVADERACHVPADQLAASPAKRHRKAVLLTDTLADGLARCAAATGRSETAIQRAALGAYLEARGFLREGGA